MEVLRKRRRGINGYSANLASLKIKKPIIRTPNTMRQMTFGEFQGNVSPPKSRPSNVMSVTPSMVTVPNQSIAFIPSQIWVFGLWTSKNSRIIRKANPASGRLIYQIHLQETFSARAPPRIGPMAPAVAHTHSRVPRTRLRRLHNVSHGIGPLI